jgi:hypothetical protein
VVYRLAEGPRHFAALRRSLPDVSAKVLAQQLRELQAAEARLFELVETGARQEIEELASLGNAEASKPEILGQVRSRFLNGVPDGTGFFVGGIVVVQPRENAPDLTFAGFVLLFFQGLSELIKRIAIMRGEMADPHEGGGGHHAAAEAEAQERKRVVHRRFMASLLPFGEQDEFTFLDLGAGTGAASRTIRSCARSRERRRAAGHSTRC